MTHPHESSYWIAKDALTKAIAEAAEKPKDAWRAASVARLYREVAECELLWKQDVEASIAALANSGQVVSYFLPTVTEADNKPESVMFGWDVADAILGLLAAKHFEQANRLSSMALNDKRMRGAAKDDFDGLFLPMVSRIVLKMKVSSDQWHALRDATKAERHMLGFCTALHGIHDRDAARIDSGLYQMELGHKKNRRNPYGSRYMGDILFPETGFYNLARHFGIAMKLGFATEFLANELLMD